MAASFKICPICETPNHPNAQVCTTCGSSLDDVEPVVRANAAQVGNVEYDFRYGETDLLENSLKRPAQTYLVITMMVLVMVGVGLVAFFIIQQPSPQDNALSAEEPLPTQTTLPLLVQTVTEGPPTATASSTPTSQPRSCAQRRRRT